MRKRRIVFERTARCELDEAVEWYERALLKLGTRFRSDVYAAVESLEPFPERHSKEHGELRRIVMRRFPYLIYYLVEEKRIVVFSVFHASRDPEELREHLE